MGYKSESLVLQSMTAWSALWVLSRTKLFDMTTKRKKAQKAAASSDLFLLIDQFYQNITAAEALENQHKLESNSMMHTLSEEEDFRAQYLLDLYYTSRENSLFIVALEPAWQQFKKTNKLAL